MKKLYLIAAAMLLCLSVAAQGSSKQFVPKAGDFSYGVSNNPVSDFSSYQPSTGDFAGSFVRDLGDYPHQMYFLGIDPKVSFQLRYHLTDNWSARAVLGLSGSTIHYREYIQDDVAHKADVNTSNRQEDCINASLKGMSLGVEAEYTKSFGALAFIAGFGAQFAVGGGSMTFDYGNGYGDYNGNKPSTMPYLTVPTADLQTLNEYGQLGDKLSYMTYARPLERYNIGDCKALAITCNMGVEYFFMGQMSLTAAVTFVPVAIYFQPQTYTLFEGYNFNSKQVETFHMPVSSGSSAVLYGTQNVGIRLGFNYYL